jgi:hypothetical protein
MCAKKVIICRQNMQEWHCQTKCTIFAIWLVAASGGTCRAQTVNPEGSVKRIASLALDRRCE